MTNQFFKTQAALARLHAGPLGPHMDLFASWLSERGYATGTIRKHLGVVADLSHWLEEQTLQVDDLDEDTISRFLEQVPRSQGFARIARAAFPILLKHLRELGEIAAFELSPPDNALDCVLHDFSQYLAQERSLAQTTITIYCREIRNFLDERFGSGPILPEKLSAEEIRQFVLRHAQTGGGATARQVASALRNFLRALRLHGEIDTDLAAAVPALATRPAKLPESLEPEQTRQLLASCDLRRADGLRDYAILLLLARGSACEPGRWSL